MTRQLAAQIDPDGVSARIERRRSERSVRVVDLGDGVSRLLADLPTPLAHAIYDRLTRMAVATDAATDVEGRAPADPGPAGTAASSGSGADESIDPSGTAAPSGPAEPSGPADFADPAVLSEPTDPAAARMPSDHAAEGAPHDRLSRDAPPAHLSRNAFPDHLSRNTPTDHLPGEALPDHLPGDAPPDHRLHHVPGDDSDVGARPTGAAQQDRAPQPGAAPHIVTTAPTPGARPRRHGVGEDPRTMDQRRADILADMLLAGAPVAHGTGLASITGHVQVTIPVLTLAGESRAPAVLPGHGPIDADTARVLAEKTPGWDRVMTDPCTGAVLAVDRYRVPAELARFLRARDERCRFPGCGRVARGCDLDHTHDAAHGGATSRANLAHLCRRHHTLKHQTAWQVRQVGGGVLEWTAPTGRRYRDRPPATVRFVPTDQQPPPF